jgi:hypothetical protein
MRVSPSAVVRNNTLDLVWDEGNMTYFRMIDKNTISFVQMMYNNVMIGPYTVGIHRKNDSPTNIPFQDYHLAYDFMLRVSDLIVI